MELALIFVLIIYAAYKDFLFMKEREKLQQKLMSRDLTDYTTNATPEAEDGKSTPDPYLPVEEASVEQILGSKDIV